VKQAANGQSAIPLRPRPSAKGRIGQIIQQYLKNGYRRLLKHHECAPYDLLQFLAAGKKTGLLRFSHAKVVKGIYFENGIIVGSSTNDPGEYC